MTTDRRRFRVHNFAKNQNKKSKLIVENCVAFVYHTFYIVKYTRRRHDRNKPYREASHYPKAGSGSTHVDGYGFKTTIAFKF